MNNRKYKSVMGTIAGLMVLTGGLFTYENVYLSNQKEEDTQVIYLAKTDIQAYASITEDMFQPVTISRDSVIRGYVQNLESVVGKELKGGLLQGEVLSSQRLGDKGISKEGNLSLKVVSDSYSTFDDGDHVKVYVQLVDSETGEVVVKELFANKKVSLPAGKDTEAGSFQVDVSESELKAYFVAKESGSIITSKIDAIDVDTITSNQTDKFDAKSDEVKNAKKEADTSKGSSVITYTIKKGDTLEGLSQKFKTKDETISALNNGKKEFNVGEIITVPAN